MKMPIVKHDQRLVAPKPLTELEMNFNRLAEIMAARRYIMRNGRRRHRLRFAIPICCEISTGRFVSLYTDAEAKGFNPMQIMSNLNRYIAQEVQS